MRESRGQSRGANNGQRTELGFFGVFLIFASFIAVMSLVLSFDKIMCSIPIIKKACIK